MSGTTPKAGKPATPGLARKPAPGSAANPSASANTPNRSPSRMTGSPGPTGPSGGASGVNRARSVRNGGPVSARAAARKPPLDGDVAALEEQKAEMQAKLDELHEKLRQAEHTLEDSQKQAGVLQKKLDEAYKDQAQLEESVHEQSEKIEDLENEKKESLRARRELEQIYEAERAQAMKEKEESQQRVEEMQSTMHRMKEVAQRGLRPSVDDGQGRPSVSRASSFRSNASPTHEGTAATFAPPGSLQRSDSRNSSKLVMQKDEIIKELKMDLAEAQLKLAEADNLGGGRLLQLQKEMYDIKMQNARLMEENESFQLLLSEKTLNGDIAHSDLLRPPSISGSSRPPSRQPDRSASGTNLADELENHVELDALDNDGDHGAGDDQVKKLQAEISNLKDQNKALTLYINNIISRLLQHEQFEQILDKTPDIMAGPGAASTKHAVASAEKELPPPPPPKDEKPAASQDPEQPQGLLQRARSVMGGRRRPVSHIVGPSDQEKLTHQLKAEEQARLTENPITAPRVPLGRSSSTRGVSGHRRANSEIPGAASVVTNMYRGPSPGLHGPVSPGLSSPTGRNSFFTAPQPLGPRLPSGSPVPTITEMDSALGKVSPPPRDSKMSAPASHRSSMISNPSANALDVADSTEESGPSSPPRSTTSSGDRDSRSGGAIMMGSKPRPLRLVQEAAEEDKEKKSANRASWFGWMNKGGVGGIPGGRSVSGSTDGMQ